MDYLYFFETTDQIEANRGRVLAPVLRFLRTVLQLLVKGASRSDNAGEVVFAIFEFLIGLVIIAVIFAVVVAVVGAIVIAISKASEEHLLPSLTSSHAIGEHKKINFWLHFYLIVIWCLGILALFAGTGEAGGNEHGVGESEGGGFFGFLIIIAALVTWLTAFYHVTVRFWKIIPPDIARCTPEKAAWFSFIPLFNLYWWFIAFRGLAEDINKTASRYGNPALISMDFATTVCVVWVCDVGISTILPELYESMGIIPVLAIVGLTTAFFIQLRNAVTTLLILKTNPPTGSTP